MSDFGFSPIDDIEAPARPRPAWQDAPITIPLEEYVKLRVLESQIAMSEKVASEKRTADYMREQWYEASEQWHEASEALSKERAEREAAQAECRRLNELIESMGGE